VDLLRALQGITGRGEHVFPGRDDRSKPMALASFRQALHVLGWSGQYSPHATRTTGSTRLNEMGYRPDWIERQLAHVEPNSVRRTYNHAEHLADRAAMMQRWADLLGFGIVGSIGLGFFTGGLQHFPDSPGRSL
jgi:integrase